MRRRASQLAQDRDAEHLVPVILLPARLNQGVEEVTVLPCDGTGPANPVRRSNHAAVIEQLPGLVSMEAYASIHGLFVPDDASQGGVLAELEPRLQIVELDRDTQRLMYTTETIRRVGGFRWSERFFAVRHRFDAPEDGMDRQRLQERTNRLIQSVFDCLRLFQVGRLYCGGIIHRATSLEGGVDIFHRPWPDDPAVLYDLSTRAAIDGLTTLWSMLRHRAVQESQFLALAIRWFSGSAESSRVEDEIINLMTAAEALFQAGTSRQKAKCIADASISLGLRAVQGEDVHQHLLDSYRLRNEILHEGHVGAWHPSGGGQLSPQDLVVFVGITAAHIRAAIRGVVAKVLASAAADAT